MNETNILQLKGQLIKLGFQGVVHQLEEYRHTLQQAFTIYSNRVIAEDQLMFSLHFERRNAHAFALRNYELRVRSIPVPSQYSGLEQRMRKADELYTAYMQGEQKPGDNDYIRNVLTSLKQLVTVDRAAAELLVFKYWPESEYRTYITDDSILKQRYEKSLSVIVTDEPACTAMQAYQQLKNTNREHVIADALLDIARFEIAHGNSFIAYNQINYFLDKPDMYFFKNSDEANEFAANNISEYDQYKIIRAASVDELLMQIPYGESLRIKLLTTKNLSDMNERNFDYLSNQLKYTGFGEDLQQQLKEKLQKQEPEFTLSFQKDYGKDETAATLHFRKSDESDIYFFNRYNLMLKNDQHPYTIKQTFYIGNKEDNITLKEAYNLMCGRAIFKEKINKEGEKYNAWQQLNFKETDAHGNFKVRAFNESYGFDLSAVLQNHPIKELQNATDGQRLIESLERGNRQSVTLTIQGKEQKVFIEAAPQFKSLNFHEASGQRIRTNKLYESNSAEQPVKQDDQKKSLKQNPGEDEGGPPNARKKSNRKRQGIS